MIAVNCDLISILIAVTPQTIRTVWALVLIVPISTLSISWFQFSKTRRLRPRQGLLGAALALATLTLSYVIFLSPAWVWGPFYSNRRYMTIGINLAISLLILVVAVVAAIKEKVLMAWIALSAVVMALLWLYAGAINSVV